MSSNLRRIIAILILVSMKMYMLNLIKMENLIKL